MSDIRGLRLALQTKLEERRKLLTDNTRLRSEVRRGDARNEFLLDTLSNPLVDYALERCADHIINEVLARAVEASKVVADQTLDSGDYEIGIDIPALHIRQHIYREDLRCAQDGSYSRDRHVSRVHYASPADFSENASPAREGHARTVAQLTRVDDALHGERPRLQRRT